MRLIDADKLYEDLANSLSSIMGDGSDGKAIDTYVAIGDIIYGTFNEQPTAYDVDAVVEQLEKEKKRAFELCLAINDKAQRQQYIIEEQTMALAIEIVKGGGLDV